VSDQLRLVLLGKPKFERNNEPLPALTSLKGQALLAYLAVTRQPHSRSALAGLLWGEMPEEVARTNLRVILSELRKVVGDAVIATRRSVEFNRHSGAWLDIEALEQAARSGADLSAVDLYRGDFMDGFYVPEAELFEAWLLGERERLRQLALEMLGQLADRALAQGQLATGVEAARRLLNIEPRHEGGHRQLMKLLAANGQWSMALAQYESCRQILAETLGVEPAAETTALNEQLKAAGNPLPHNLPPLTTFIGREQELSHLLAQLQQPDCRLLTLIGPGGIGKTRLAIEVARACVRAEGVSAHSLTSIAGQSNFLDGVHFVNLASVSLAETTPGQSPKLGNVSNLILATVATVLNFSFHGAGDLKAQLFGYLHQKQMLLVLDNFEHLIEASWLLVELLQAAPGVRLLVTSRERLNVREEWVREIGGLAYPEEGWKRERLEEEYSAIALFCQRVQRVRTGFSLSENEAPYVLRLCQLVEGAPLALELAASWLRTLTCAEVVTEVERSLDFLTSSIRNLPERHRSMRAVFEQSWQMLSAPEQTIFRQLSLFKGGFQREAAQVIAGAGLPTLASLMDKSLLRLTASGRYQVHETLRQFAAEKPLAEVDQVETPSRLQAGSALTVWQRYSAYYLELLNQREASLRGDSPRPVLAELGADVDNIRQAWQWAALNGQIKEIEAALGGLARFYDLTNLFQEGATVFGQTAFDLQPYLESSDEVAGQRTLVKLWVEQARLLNRRGLSEQALQLMPKTVELAHQIQDISLEALAYHQWGETLSFQGQPALSQARLEEALRLARAAGLGAIEAETLRHLAIARRDQGDAATALKLYGEALTCFRRLKDRHGEALVLNNLGNVSRKRGHFDEARLYYEQSLQIFREIGYLRGQDTVLNNLGNMTLDLGHYSQAQALYQQGLQICDQIQDYWGKAHLLDGLGNTLREQGDYDSAQSYYEQALQLWAEIGARFYEGVTLSELALLWHLKGNNEAACDYSQQANQIGQQVGSPEMRAPALSYLGHALLELGFLREAAENYQQALTLHREAGHFHLAREAQAGLIRVALIQNHLAQAQAYAVDLLPQLTLENLQGIPQPFRVFLTCYRLLLAGHDPRAETVLATAYHLLQERAAQIEDDRLRRSFLKNVAAHREIVEEFQQKLYSGAVEG
jgi:DNA-binding SARP family transcriptional activator/predicted ATPase/Tfp pilus assembly protein PilF